MLVIRKLFFFIALFLLGVIAALLVFRFLAYMRETDQFGTLPHQSGYFVDTSEGAIFVLERGPVDGPPVIFGHGTAAWSGLWLETLDHMASQGFRAIAFDMPPFGYSDYPERGDYSRVRQAARFIALVQALGVTSPIAVGHSFGAGPISEGVLLRPDLFDGLVLVDGAIALNGHENPKPTPWFLRNDTLREFQAASTISNPLLTKQFLRNFISLKEAATPDRVAILKQPMSRRGYTKAASAWLPELFNAPSDAASTRPDAWAALSVPTALIWGETDTITPLDQAEALMNANEAISLSVISGVGHIPQIEAPEMFQKVLLETLRKLSKENET